MVRIKSFQVCYNLQESREKVDFVNEIVDDLQERFEGKIGFNSFYKKKDFFILDFPGKHYNEIRNYLCSPEREYGFDFLNADMTRDFDFNFMNYVK